MKTLEQGIGLIFYAYMHHFVIGKRNTTRRNTVYHKDDEHFVKTDTETIIRFAESAVLYS